MPHIVGLRMLRTSGASLNRWMQRTWPLGDGFVSGADCRVSGEYTFRFLTSTGWHMAYHSLTLHMLISAPGDVDPEDMRTVHRTVNRWNFRQGRRMVPSPVTVVPVSWTDHAYSEFGIRPQESLNHQLVEEADLAFAMFADRLGTPTGEADSGTVEEMNVMRQAGKHVSLVRSTAPRAVNGPDATAEKLRLENYLSDVMDGKAVVYSYDSREDLASQVEHVLSFQAELFSRRVNEHENPASEAGNGASGETQDDPNRGVWPKIEVTERPETDSRGKLKTKLNRFLVLQNETGGAARNVRFRYEDREGDPEHNFDLGFDADNLIQVMAPGSEQRVPVFAAWQSVPEAMCVVTWEDDGGEYETRATVRM